MATNLTTGPSKQQKPGDRPSGVSAGVFNKKAIEAAHAKTKAKQAKKK